MRKNGESCCGVVAHHRCTLIVTPLLVVVQPHHGSSTLGFAKGCLGALPENSTSGDPKGSLVGNLDDDDARATGLCQDPRGRDECDLLRLCGISSPVQPSQAQRLQAYRIHDSQRRKTPQVDANARRADRGWRHHECCNTQRFLKEEDEQSARRRRSGLGNLESCVSHISMLCVPIWPVSAVSADLWFPSCPSRKRYDIWN